MADQIAHAIWRSEIHRAHIEVRGPGEYSVGRTVVGPNVHFKIRENHSDLSYVRSRIQHHHECLTAALALERFLDSSIDETEELIDRLASALYRQWGRDDRPWFEVEDDDPELAESFRRMARLTDEIYSKEARRGE